MERRYSRSSQLRPGDVVGFASHSALDALINLATWGIPGIGISHVALVAPHPEYDYVPGMQERLLLFESTTRNPEPCALSGKHVQGVQAHKLYHRLKDYRGAVWRYPLSTPLDEQRRANLKTYCVNQLGLRYDRIGAFRARGLTLIERLLYRPEDLSAVFCSELVAAALRYVGEFRARNVSCWNPNRLCRELVRRGVCRRPERIG